MSKIALKFLINITLAFLFWPIPTLAVEIAEPPCVTFGFIFSQSKFIVGIMGLIGGLIILPFLLLLIKRTALPKPLPYLKAIGAMVVILSALSIFITLAFGSFLLELFLEDYISSNFALILLLFLDFYLFYIFLGILFFSIALPKDLLEKKVKLIFRIFISLFPLIILFIGFLIFVILGLVYAQTNDIFIPPCPTVSWKKELIFAIIGFGLAIFLAKIFRFWLSQKIKVEKEK